ncbi:MAG: hypothetical protein ACHQ9S_19225 [Candidatus Binatia bacterium]
MSSVQFTPCPLFFSLFFHDLHASAGGAFCGLGAGVSSGVSWFVDQALNRIQLVLGRQVRIPLGHHDRLVTEQLLNCPQINAFHHQSARKGVAQIMPAEVLNARLL